jgi:hypothetical protein
MDRRCTLAVAALCLLPLAAEAQESYTIVVKKGAKGSVTQEQRTDTDTSATKFADKAGGLLKEETTKVVQTQVFQQTILEQPEGKKKPTKLKRVYEKAVVAVNNESQVLPYQGKTVLIENKGGKFSFRYEGGGEITGDDAKWLQKEFKDQDGNKDEPELDDLLFPKQAVKVGEPWNIPMAEFVKKFGEENLDLFAEKCKGTGKLVKAYKEKGRQFGDIVIKLEMPVKAVKTLNGDIVMQTGAMVLELKGSICIDGSVEDGKGQLSVQFNGEALLPSPDNPQVRGTFSTHNLHDSTTTELPKK